MSQSVGNAGKLTFGVFEVDLAAGELYRAGYRVKIQGQPFKVLLALLEQPGQVVTRDELQIRIWGRDTVVEFDRSLSAAVNKVREALGDSAENPRFIETLARRGYRFIAPVQRVPLSGPIAAPELVLFERFPNAISRSETSIIQNGAADSVPVLPEEVPFSTRPAAKLNRWHWWLVLSLMVALAGDALLRYAFRQGAVRVVPPHMTRITASGNLAPCFQVEEKFAATDTDGVRLFASVLRDGRSRLEAISLSDGATADVPIPDQVVDPVLGQVSPDGSQFIVRSQLSRETEQPLWVIPAMGGSALRVGSVFAHDAAWMPDGKVILYAAGSDLYLTRLTHAEPQLYAELPGPAYWMRWSPDGSLLRFTIIDPITDRLSLWQISRSDRAAKPVLPDWGKRASNCCGNWTADGRSFVFQSSQGGDTDLWSLGFQTGNAPQRLTDGPMKFLAPVAARSGNRIYFLGNDVRAAMDRFRAIQHNEEPEENWLKKALRVAYSRDGQWVSWTMPDGSLWRSRSNGSERLQLTPVDMEVFLADWSPDDSRLAIMARVRDQAWHIYVVPSTGGHAQLAFDDGHNAGDPSWGPDGQHLVFGRLNDVMGKDSAVRTLQTVDLRTGLTATLPGSQGLYSPRWSPDGKFIAALSMNGLGVNLFNVAHQQWTRLPLSSGADPHWSRDSHSLFVHEFADPMQPIVRISVPDGRVQENLNLVKPEDHSRLAFIFSGVTPGGDMLVRTGTNCSNLYTMDVGTQAGR